MHSQNEGKEEKAVEEEVQGEAKQEALRKREVMFQASWKVRLKGVLKPNLVLVVLVFLCYFICAIALFILSNQVFQNLHLMPQLLL